MDGVQVRSSIKSIYDRFSIPRSLRLHMYRVASIAEMVCDNWKGPRIEKDDIVAACLLHDVGNIVKFDFDSGSTISILNESESEISRLKKLKDEVVAKYGRIDNEASHNMMKELEVDKVIISIVDEMSHIFDEKDKGYEVMVCSYADFRVEPDRISSVTERFTDFAKRNKNNPNSGMKARSESVMSKLPKALEIERDIFANVTIMPEEINDKSIKPYLDRYMK
jgi:predicted HD phosphohydrolase